MTSQHRTTWINARRGGGVALFAALVAVLAGCHSPAEQAAPAPPTAAQAAASNAQQVTTVQNNPNIPPEAKAHITSQVQGQAGPPKPTAPPP